jgi:hypothetical protein
MLVKHLSPKDGDLWLVPGDIHFDSHDPQALNLMLRVAADLGVNGCVLIGDTFESAGISRHGRPTRKFCLGRATIGAEREAAQPYLATIQALVRAHGGTRGKLHVLTGNHEHWWAAVQDDYPGLLDTPWFELYGNIFDGWHVHAEYTALKLGPLLIAHGHRLRGSLARFSAASVLANYPGQNTLYGHTHRIDSCTLPTHKYGEPVRHGAWTVGHLRSIPATFKDPALGPHSERHSQGFGLVSFHDIEGDMRFSVELVCIDREHRERPYTIVRGKKYV